MHKSHHQLISSFEDPIRDQWQKPELVSKLIAPLKDLEVIDIGLAAAISQNTFLRQERELQAQMSHSRKRFDDKEYPYFVTLKIDYDDFKMKHAFFDMAFTSNTYHYIENSVEYLKMVKTGPKPSGRVVILDFKKSQEKKAHFGPQLNMLLHVETVLSELKQAGFNEIIATRRIHQTRQVRLIHLQFF